jgi:hypothetical protein
MPFASILGAGIIGDLIGASSQRDTNSANTANMMQNEQWQTQMSNTAMQRRVVDLQQAGLNPLLATSTNGATVGSVSQPNLQAPGASFNQLGGQMAQAQQTAANIRLTNAQAAKTEWETGNNGNPTMLDADGNIDYTRGGGGAMGNQNLQNALQQNSVLRQQANQLSSSAKALLAAAASSDADTMYTTARRELAQLDLKGQKALYDWFINDSKAAARSNIAENTASAKVWEGTKGAFIKAAQELLPSAHSAVSTFNKTQYPTTGR